uniref:ADAMTS-like 7 n=1 Tax=Maylandia zebra TaxID=106582 RepID=A0A3P9D2Y8_9CICH
PNSFCLVHLVSSDRFLEVPRMPVSLVHGCWVFTAGDWRLRPGCISRMTSTNAVNNRGDFPALLSQRGVSIINGNWLINRPGIYVALGTYLTYRRPNEIRSRNGESITAPGPLTEDLHVYVRWKMKNTDLTKLPIKIKNNLSFIMRYEVIKVPLLLWHMEPLNSNFLVAETVDFSYPDDDGKTKQSIIKEAWHPNQVPSYPTVNSESHVTYTWMKNGHTECSTTCGTGKKLVHINLCINIKAHHVSILLANSWDVGEWSECSRRCGPGTQHRQVICRQVTDVHASGTETSVTVKSEMCGSSDMPVTQSTCQLKICSQWDIRSEWSPCSVPCGVGQRTREVVCVSNQGDVDDDQECNMNLKPDTIENCDMGLCARSWFTSIWSQRCSAECGRGSRTRSVVCLMDHAQLSEGEHTSGINNSCGVKSQIEKKENHGRK